MNSCQEKRQKNLRKKPTNPEWCPRPARSLDTPDSAALGFQSNALLESRNSRGFHSACAGNVLVENVMRAVLRPSSQQKHTVVSMKNRIGEIIVRGDTSDSG